MPSGASFAKFFVVCETIQGFLDIAIVHFEPRRLALGTQRYGPIEPKAAVYQVAGSDSCMSPSAQVTFTVDVTRAEGSLAPYPDAVTPDYVGELSVHVEFQGGDPDVSPGGLVCLPPSGAVDVHFVETAADVVKEPNATCVM